MRCFSLLLAFLLLPVVVHAAANEKDWTLLVFLNGKNSLDRFGDMDMNEMESIGTTDKINVVVEWGKMRDRTVGRYEVRADLDKTTVTSPMIQNLGSLDMGDYNNLVDFAEWGIVNYPAKRYFIVVWNHGSGWVDPGESSASEKSFNPAEGISFDDATGHFITTRQLGDAMRKISGFLGRKIDVYGSDACLMSMAEVASEMTDSVKTFVGSQETEPGEGWPYDAFLKDLNTNSKAWPNTVGTMLAKAYRESYQGGSQGNSSATMSVLNLLHFDDFAAAVRALSTEVLGMPNQDLNSLKEIAKQSQHFYESDYIDVMDFLTRVETSGLGVSKDTIRNLEDAYAGLLVANETTADYSDATGLSFWIPYSQYRYKSYIERYQALHFSALSLWGDAISKMYSTPPVWPERL